MALVGLLFIIALWDIGKTAVKHARDDYGKSRAAGGGEGGEGSLARFPHPSPAQVLVRRHATGYWLSEILHSFPVTREGWRAGWIAHRTARAEERARVVDSRAVTLTRRSPWPGGSASATGARLRFSAALSGRGKRAGKPLLPASLGDRGPGTPAAAPI